MDVQPIEPVTILHGHVSPDTAFLVENHPYKQRLRCRIRFWIETTEWRLKRGQRRFVMQTSNPRLPGEPWNRPRVGKYRPLMWMFRDQRGDVHHTEVDSQGRTPSMDAWFRLARGYEQIPEADRRLYDAFVQIAMESPAPGQHWNTVVSIIVDYLHSVGEPPELDDGFVSYGGRQLYVGNDDYPVAVAAARCRISLQHGA